jgi:diguanylate cyclase (GGDEF)-like protein/PAS domain S-box-containing protein
MNSNFNFFYLISAVIISSIIGIYSWRYRQSRGCRAFAVLILVSILWMSGSIFFSLSHSLSARWLGRAIMYLGIPGVPVALLVFVYRYCGKTIRRRNIILLSIVPLISWIVLADPFNYLFGTMAEDMKTGAFSLRGYYFWWVHIPYSYLLLMASLATVFLEISRASKQYRGQIMMLFVAMCIPFTADLLGLTGILGETNFSPISFLIFFILMAIAITRYQFLGNNPIAYEIVFQTIRDGVIILDRHDVIRDINTAAAQRLGKDVREITGRPLEEVFAGRKELVSSFQEKKRQREATDTTVAFAESYISIDVTPLMDIDETARGWIITLRDVTQRKQEQISLEKLAFHDPLTQLANRRKFDEEVERAIADFSDTKKSFAILYLDLNRFKVVNDTMGHEVGDELLKYVSARLTSTLRKPDILARVGGDEFAVLLHDTDEIGARRVVERMLGKVKKSFKVGEHKLTAEISIGAAVYPQNGSNLTELMRYADSAMYRAKSQSGGHNLYRSESILEM